MDITRKQFDQAVREFTANYASWEEDGDGVRENYSGRGMYGRTCIGVVGDSLATAFQFMYSLAEVIHEDELYDQKEFVMEMVEALVSDGMGRSSLIYYFPGYTIAEEG